MSDPSPTPTPLRRRWFQFGLRTMFVVVAASAVSLWWMIPSVASRVAVDPEQNCDDRIAAAETLGSTEADRLRWTLMLRVTEKSAIDDIAIGDMTVRGEIGDRRALELLEALKGSQRNCSERIHTALKLSTERIQARLGPLERTAPDAPRRLRPTMAPDWPDATSTTLPGHP